MGRGNHRVPRGQLEVFTIPIQGEVSQGQGVATEEQEE